MSPAVAWLIAELAKLAVEQIQNMGKFDSLTEDEAKAMVQSIADSLSTSLPSPAELEAPAAAPKAAGIGPDPGGSSA